VKRCKFSYSDVKGMDREERSMFLAFLKEEVLREKEAMDEIKRNNGR
jgi:hypothetical protein